ncbi:hypothetical protein C5E44_00360 [Nocardia nova]|nr:hypothetical protein C5E44_00360 [Nocardia nova]
MRPPAVTRESATRKPVRRIRPTRTSSGTDDDRPISTVRDQRSRPDRHSDDRDRACRRADVDRYADSSSDRFGKASAVQVPCADGRFE